MLTEPVITQGAIVALIMATVLMLKQFGLLDWTEEQSGAVETWLVLLVGVLGPLVGAWWARNRVTPLADPKDNDGRKLVPKE